MRPDLVSLKLRVGTWGDCARRLGSETRLEGRAHLSCPFPPGFLRSQWEKAYNDEDHALRTHAA